MKLNYAQVATKSPTLMLLIAVACLFAPAIAIIVKMVDYDKTFNGSSYPGRALILWLVSILILLPPIVGTLSSAICVMNTKGALWWCAIWLLIANSISTIFFLSLFIARF